MAHLDRERFVVVLLDTKNAVVATHTVSVGTLTSSLVHPREVFKPAILASAAGIILAHNHPSGKTEPSREDREVTERIARAGKTLGIEEATQEQTGGPYTLVEILVPEFPMEESLLHVHHFEDEGFYILEGEMTFYVCEQTIKARPGSCLFGPKDIPHAFSVDSGPARLLFILSPAGMEGLIREMGQPAKSLSILPPPEEPPDEAEMGRLMAIATKYGGEMLGPPPSR
jgi:mannose-6-phosphate isomerase-like protein (cupin superfamily)